MILMPYPFAVQATVIYGSFYGHTLAHLGEVDIYVVQIVFRILQDERVVLVVERAALLSGNARPQGARRYNSMFRQDGARGQDGPFADAAIVEDNHTHAHEHRIFHRAAVDGR